uniref:Putative secreted protein n=1 Tax=Anopheles marajoara TaxID=58244 RepID=A0A2M4C5J6_9DIPT
MRPEQNSRFRMIGMAQNLNVLVLLDELLFAVVTVDAERKVQLLEQQHKDLDPLLGLALQYLIQPPIVPIDRRSLHVDLRAEHPVGDEDFLGGPLERVGHGTHITGPIHEPTGLDARSGRSERLVWIGQGEIARTLVRNSLHVPHPILGHTARRMLDDEIPRVGRYLQPIPHPGTVHTGRDVEALIEQHDTPEHPVLWPVVPEARFLHEEPPIAPLAPDDITAEVTTPDAASTRQTAAKVTSRLTGPRRTGALLNQSFLTLATECRNERQM